MAKFAYVVKDQNGKTFNNVIDAPDKNALVSRLQQQKYFVVSVKQIDSHVKSSPKRKQKTKQPARKFTHKKVKMTDMIAFARQLATMLEAGVTLIRTLNVIQGQIQSKNFYDAMAMVRSDVEQGTSLSRAIAKHPKIFNQFWISLIEVGEASGTIPRILNKLAFYIEQQAAFRSAIVSGIIYPLILFCVCIGAVAFFALFVGPRFEAIFVSMGADLPILTELLLAFFKFIKEKFVFIIGFYVVLVWLFRRFVKTYQGKLVYEHFLFNMPVIGEIYKLIIVERFSSQLSILIESGVPILYSLDIVERLVDNNTCAMIISDIKQGVKQGELLVAPMERSGFFPSMCLQMILVGEETGELSKMLKHVSKFYQDIVETFMKRFSTIIEPVMLVFMGGVIGTIVLAMFLPMFNISQLGGG